MFLLTFDTVNHDTLIKKLELIGIESIVLELTKSYIYGRKKRVRMGDFLSNDQHNITTTLIKV